MLFYTPKVFLVCHVLENNWKLLSQRVRVCWLKTGRPEAVNLKENHVLRMYNALSILFYFG